jgi:hypothetical protein
MPDLFRLRGLGIRRERALVVHGSRAPWAFTAGFEQAIDRFLAAQVHDGVLRLWIEGDSAPAWRVAEKWIAYGRGSVGVALAAPVADLLIRQASEPNRDRIAAVLRQADRFHFGERLSIAQATHLTLCIDLDEACALDNSYVIDAEGRMIASKEGGFS